MLIPCALQVKSRKCISDKRSTACCVRTFACGRLNSNAATERNDKSFKRWDNTKLDAR